MQIGDMNTNLWLIGCSHSKLPGRGGSRMAEKVLATLTFDAASGRSPLQFLLSNDGKNVITVGRAPKSVPRFVDILGLQLIC